jgi:autotransporter-associated beta strand protein
VIVLALSIFPFVEAYAVVACLIYDNTASTISSSSTNTCFNWLSGDLTITASTTLTSNTGISIISALSGSTVGTLTNNGTINSNMSSGGFAFSELGLRATMTALNNTGIISSSSDNVNPVYITNTIGSVTNTGSIYTTSSVAFGIYNSGTIGTLNNSQGAGNAHDALTYTGSLPTNYNIIVNSATNYGRLAATSVTGTTSFGISPLSTPGAILNTPLTSVLSGITPANLRIGSVTTFGGFSNGYTYTLSETGDGTNIWNLLITACSGCSTYTGSSSDSSGSSGSSGTATKDTSSAVKSGTSVSAADLTSGAVSPVLAGGTLALNAGDSVKTPITVTSAGGVLQSPSSGSAVIASPITGAGGLTVTGTGTTVLTGANTYSGGTTVASGTLQGSTTSLQGAILNNAKVVFAQSTSGTFAGTIAGTGAVVVQNTGTLVLSGSNTYSGGTTVSGGTLTVAGNAPTGTGDVVLAEQAVLMGTGNIAGNVLVAGTFKPGNSPGYLSVAKDVTFNSGSVYQQDIAGTTQANNSSPVGATGYYSYLSVGGQLVINSGATLTPTLQNLFQTTESGYGSAAYVPSVGDTFRIATATGGISGTFSSVTQPAGLASGTAFIPFYNYGGSNSLDLAVIPTSYATTLASATTNTQSVASVLDKLSAVQMAGTATATQTNLMYSTATQTASSLASFAQALAGEIYSATVAVVHETTQRVQSAVLARLSETSMSAFNVFSSPAINPNGVTPQNPMGTPNASFSTNPEVNPYVISPYNPSVWGEIAYQYGNRSGDSNSSGYSSNLYQTVFGADIYQENGIKAGAGFALSNTGVSNSLGSGTVSQGSIFAYGKMPVLEDYVLDGMVLVGLDSMTVTRTDPTSSTSLKAKNILGRDLLLSAGISRPIELEEYDLTLTPYARVTYQMVNQSPFDEGTTSPASLSVNGYSGSGARGVIGISLGSRNKDPMVSDYTYKVNLALGAETNTLINPTLTASLAGFGTTIQTASVGSTFVQAGLFGTAKVGRNAFVYGGLSGEARSGQKLGTINIGLKVQF